MANKHSCTEVDPSIIKLIQDLKRLKDIHENMEAQIKSFVETADFCKQEIIRIQGLLNEASASEHKPNSRT